LTCGYENKVLSGFVSIQKIVKILKQQNLLKKRFLLTFSSISYKLRFSFNCDLFFVLLFCGKQFAIISETLQNKELNDEKLGRKRFGKITKKRGEKPNVKMGKRGGGGPDVRKR
jgi:hypothetical protein